MKRISQLGVLLAAGFASTALYAQVLSVENLSGRAQLTRNEIAIALTLADPVVDQDRVQVANDARLTLKLGAHGFIDLGPGAELYIERLPYARFADDLRTVLHLRKGYLRVVWNHPPAAARWPLFVRAASHLLQLSNGEFFFETTAETTTACASTGQMIEVDSRTPGKPLLDALCHQLGTQPPQSTTYRAHDWVPLREGFAIRAPVLAAPEPAAATVEAAREGRQPLVQIETVPAAPAGVPTRSASGWILNLGSFTRAAGADRHAETLRAAGYPAQVSRTEIRGHTHYRVQLSGYATHAEASAAKAEVGKKLGIQDAWIHRD